MAGLTGPLLLVGCGKMGGALLQGWLDNGLAAKDALVVEPAAALRARVEALGVRAVADPAELPPDLAPLAMVFAIKPQAMASTLPHYAALAASSGAVVLSIAAGTVIARFEAAFGADTAVVRAMPNTPAAIGQGVSALFANPRASAAQKELCGRLMAAVGQIHWIDDEAEMHAITAMSGGAPAYVFLLIEALAEAGIAAGLKAELAWPLARASVAGSGALAAASDEPAAVLRQNVTSPGGTTEAALGVLMGPGGMEPLFERAIAAGTARSLELA